jgi:hypothetical protein
VSDETTTGAKVMTPKALLLAALCASCLFVSSDVRAGGSVHVKLVAEPGGRFFVAKPPHLWPEPSHVTLALRQHGKLHVRMLGVGPGGVFFAGGKLSPVKWHFLGPGGNVKVGPGGFKLKGPHGHGHGGGVKIKF